MAGDIHRVATLFVTVPALLFVLLAFYLSLLYGQTDLASLCLLVFGVAGGLRVWGSFSPRAVDCFPEVDRDRVFAGEHITLRVAIENRKPLPVRLDVEVPIDGMEGSGSENEVLTAGNGALWYERLLFHWKVTASRRGVYDIGPLRLTSADLLGFFPKDKEAWGPFQVIVYPRLAALKPFSLPKRDFFGSAGSQSPVKDPLYILGTTDYLEGRPARYIHWKASARHHRLQEKLFESSRQEKALLIVDVEGFTGGRADGPFERTLEVVASLAVQLDRRGVAVGFLTNGGIKGKGAPFLSVTRNGGQLPGILETLARLYPEAEGDMGHLLDHKLPLPWGVSCVYFAFEESQGTRMARESLHRRKIPVVSITTLHLHDYGAVSSPDVGMGPGR